MSDDRRIPVGVPHDFVSNDGRMFCDADLPGYGRCGFIRSAGWHTGVTDSPPHSLLAEVEREGPASDAGSYARQSIAGGDGKSSRPPLKIPLGDVTVGADGDVAGYVIGGPPPEHLPDPPPHAFKGGGTIRCQRRGPNGHMCGQWHGAEIHAVPHVPPAPTRPSPTTTVEPWNGRFLGHMRDRDRGEPDRPGDVVRHVDGLMPDERPSAITLLSYAIIVSLFVAVLVTAAVAAR